MFYLWKLDSHELYGPFTERPRAHAYAQKKQFGPYQVWSDSKCQNICDPGSIRLVPNEDR